MISFRLNKTREWLKYFGIPVGTDGQVLLTDAPETRHVACWGWRIGSKLRRQRHEVLVFERGYLGNRRHWTSIGWNGLNGRAYFQLDAGLSMDRFNQHFRLSPWKTGGDCIIIAGQVRGDQSLEGRDLTRWYEEIAKELELLHGLPVLFKPHPMVKAIPSRIFAPQLPLFQGTMAEACQRARCIVCWNSNAAVDAVIAGCPAMTFDRGSMAWEVTSHNVANIITPERDAWAARLAWCQWSPEEIASGAFWQRMLRGI